MLMSGSHVWESSKTSACTYAWLTPVCPSFPCGCCCCCLQVLGSIPASMSTRASRDASKFFTTSSSSSAQQQQQPYRLAWPDGKTSSKSKSAVK